MQCLTYSCQMLKRLLAGRVAVVSGGLLDILQILGHVMPVELRVVQELLGDKYSWFIKRFLINQLIHSYLGIKK